MAETTTQTLEPIAKPIDYLVIGHVTADLTPQGTQLGGTVTFSSLTAKALGFRTGIITAHGPDLETSSLADLWIKNKPSPATTTFENISDGIRRTQYLYSKAASLGPEDVPAFSPSPAILHLGPVADEVNPQILMDFPNSLKCLTPQGWFRGVDSERKVHPKVWEKSEETLAMADVAVISQEDVQYDEEMIEKMAAAIPVFVVTENIHGARVYWHNEPRYFNAPEVKYVDDTGAGDIFATAFFYRYWATKNPWEAGRFAVQIASNSVARNRLDSVPTPKEIERTKIEII
ncbi:MAG: PfkB family carbohydrate kinase [Chloroflexota bacterium]|nr:PfkB family carbohydrate kinase [Chloroflexota bacterium]